MSHLLAQALSLESPRIETADRIFVMGLSPCGDYGAARLQAARLLYELLTREAGLTPWEAYAVISARGDLTLGGPTGAIVLGSIARSWVMGVGSWVTGSQGGRVTGRTNPPTP
jgi:hypothetical protein